MVILSFLSSKAKIKEILLKRNNPLYKDFPLAASPSTLSWLAESLERVSYLSCKEGKLGLKETCWISKNATLFVSLL